MAFDEKSEVSQTYFPEGKHMKSKHKNLRPHGLAVLIGLGLAANGSLLRAEPASPGNPGPSRQGPAAGAMIPPEKASKADPMAEYQRLGKPNQAPPRTAPAVPGARGVPPPAAAQGQGRTYLHCVFKLRKDGGYRLERAVQVEGAPLVSDEAAGPIIAEVSKGSDVVSVQAHIDPFERRGFSSPPGKGPQGHHFDSDDEAEVVVKIPDASLADTDLDKLSVRLYRWQGADALEHIDRESLREYKRLNRVRGLSEIPGRVLGGEIRSKGIRAPR
jgi:hypothetical protein